MNLRAPALLLTGIAACSGGPSGPTISITTRTPAGWSGTTEVLIHDAAGSFVTRQTFTDHVDIPLAEGQVLTISAFDVAPWFETYYGLSAGESIEIPLGRAPTTPTLHDVYIQLPSGSATALVDLSIGGVNDLQQAPGTVVHTRLSTDRMVRPMLASVVDNGAVTGFYGAAAVDTTSGNVAVDQPLTLDTVAVGVGTQPTGATVRCDGWVWAGDQTVHPPAPTSAAPTTLVLPTGLGDHHEVLAAVTSSGTVRTAIVSYAGDAPAQADLSGDLAALPTLTTPRFDGMATYWVLTGTASKATWGFTAPPFGGNGIAAVWNFTAPADMTRAPVPLMPQDLQIVTVWSPQMFYLLSSAETDYTTWVTTPAWTTTPGTHRWGSISTALSR